MKKIKVVSVFGTRPEAIKMAPVIKELMRSSRFDSKIIVTGQHKEMLDQTLASFKIVPNYNLEIMRENQSLTSITSRIIQGLETIFQSEKPDLILVHGDTTTAFAAALAAFYEKILIGHVEAGLRTGDKNNPFPEEMNRSLIDQMSDFMFAPTEKSKENLVKENLPQQQIYVTGNTSIDALFNILEQKQIHNAIDANSKEKIILVTMHRRENIGQPMEQVFSALKKIANEYQEFLVVFPVHKNPKVREIAYQYLDGQRNIKLIEPLNTPEFYQLLSKSYLVLTDSGGIQEEAPSLGVPVLIVRDTTERPEGIAAGTLKLIGTEEERVYSEIKHLLSNNSLYQKMSKAKNPYGDGQASERIVNQLEQHFSKMKNLE